MKSKFRCSIICFALLMAALVLAPAKSKADTTNSPGGTFFSSVGGYFTSFNTNSTTFTSDRAEVWTGTAYQSGLNFADDFGIDVNFKKGGGFYGESVTRNAGVAGTIVNQRAGIGYSIAHYDTRLAIGLNGGYDFNARRPLLDIYADVRKALTDNTYSGLRIGYQSDFSSKTPGAPVLELIVGFKF